MHELQHLDCGHSRWNLPRYVWVDGGGCVDGMHGVEEVSANLLRTSCYYCPSDVVLVEAPWVMTPEKNSRGPQYLGMRFANAECPACLAQYLAWCDPHEGHPRIDGVDFYDLSFRSSFNDEPDDRDLPRYVVERQLVRVGPFTDAAYMELGALCPTCNAETLRPARQFGLPVARGAVCYRCDVQADAKKEG